VSKTISDFKTGKVHWAAQALVATFSTGRGTKSKLNQHGRAQLFRLERHGAHAAASG
jgi:hypothetical protein